MADILLSLGVDTTQVQAQLEAIASQVQQAGKVSVAPKIITQPYEQAKEEIAKLGIEIQKTAEAAGAKFIPAIETSVAATAQMSRGYNVLSGLTIPNLLKVYQGLSNEYQRQTKSTYTLKGDTKSLGDTIGALGEDFKKALPRMLLWGIGWMTIYGIYRKFLQAIGELIGAIFQLDDAMARISIVTQGAGSSHSETMNKMKKEMLSYVSSSRAELTDVSEVLYVLGKSGLTASQSMTVFKNVMNLTIGTLGNAKSIAELVADSFQVFGKNLKGASTDVQKFKQISDILAYTFATQQVEMDEITQSLYAVGSASRLLDVDFKTMVLTIGFLNSGMLKGCYSEDTEILTDKGWKYFKDLDKTELVVTLNPKTNELEYQKPLKYIDEPYAGLMYKLKNRHLDLLVTPNHWIYSKMATKKFYGRYKRRQAFEVFGKPQIFIRGAKWRGKKSKYFILPSVELNYGGFQDKETVKLKIEIKDWVRFLAWYLSEGTLGYRKDAGKKTEFKIKIFQSEGKTREEIREILKRLPFKFYESKSCNRVPAFVINSKQLCSYLRQFGKSHEKFIPQDIKDLSSELLKIFIKTYALGDGRTGNNNIEITTSSKKMRDDLQEISLKAGFASTYNKGGKGSFKQNHSIWKIYISKKTEFNFNQKANLKNHHGFNHTTVEKWTKYIGRQYCVEVPNGIVFIRRNGKTVWCGNSKAGMGLFTSMVNIAQHSDVLAEKFGIALDPTKPINFVEVMEKLHDKLGDTTLSAEQTRAIMEVFGNRSVKAVSDIIERFEEWKKAISVTERTWGGFEEKLRKNAEKTLPGAFKIMGNRISIETMNRFEEIFQGLKKIVTLMNKLGLGTAFEIPDTFMKVLKTGKDYAKDETETKKEGQRVASELFRDEQIRLETLKKEAEFQHLTNAGIYDYKVTREKITFQIKQATDIIEKQQDKEEAITILSGMRADNLKEVFSQVKQYAVTEEDVAKIYKLITDYQEQILERDREIVKIFSTQIEESLYNIIKGTGTWKDMLQSISDELLKLQLKRLVHKLTIDLFEQPTDKFGLAAQNFGSWVKEFGQHVYSLLTGKGIPEQAAALVPAAATVGKTLSKEEMLKNFGLAGVLGAGAAIAKTQTAPPKVIGSKEELLKNFGLTGVLGAGAAIANTQIEEKQKIGFDFTQKEKIDTTAMLVDRLDNYKNKLDEVNGSISRLESGEAQAFGISKQEWLGKLTEKADDYRKTIGFVEDQISQVSKVKPIDQTLGITPKGLQGLTAAGNKVKGIMSEMFPQQKGAGKILGGIGGAMQVYQATQTGGGAGALQGAMGGGQLGMMLGGPTGAAIGAIAGGLLGYFGGKKAKKQDEVAHQTVQIGSRIDITNAQLSIANRNLSSMKRSFEGWGLAITSSYFSERMGVEARFAGAALRGYSG